MRRCADLASEGREALLARDYRRLGRGVNENFDVRKSICKLDKRNVDMVDTARALGAAAHYAGSGGSILGIYEDAGMLERLRKAFEAMGCRLIVPVVTSQRCGSSS